MLSALKGERNLRRRGQQIVEIVQIHGFRVKYAQSVNVGDHPLHDVQIAEERMRPDPLRQEVTRGVIQPESFLCIPLLRAYSGQTGKDLRQRLVQSSRVSYLRVQFFNDGFVFPVILPNVVSVLVHVGDLVRRDDVPHPARFVEIIESLLIVPLSGTPVIPDIPKVRDGIEVVVLRGQFIVLQGKLKLAGLIIQPAKFDHIVRILRFLYQELQRLRIDKRILLGGIRIVVVIPANRPCLRNGHTFTPQSRREGGNNFHFSNMYCNIFPDSVQ